jgi:signal transduction histidine kinase
MQEREQELEMSEARTGHGQTELAIGYSEQMMAVLSHDLRNPLSAVRCLASLLQLQEGLPANVHRGLERIEQAARRMNEMIETLTDFARSRSQEGFPVSVERVDLVELCRTVVDELRVAHPHREIRLTAPNDVTGYWDTARLAQVVSNLVGNALTHGAGGAAIDLSVIADDKHAMLNVTNRGPAIPPELMDHIFDPFRQGGANHRHGLGLGLYIVRAIVRAHRGTISIRSTEQTTTFSVRLERSVLRPQVASALTRNNR